MSSIYCLLLTLYYYSVLLLTPLPFFIIAATVPPEDVRAVQADNHTVCVSWSAIPSDRQPDVPSDITFYEVEYYSIGGAIQEPTNIQTGTSTGLSINIPYQQNNQMVLAARVRGVTQLRREPDSLDILLGLKWYSLVQCLMSQEMHVRSLLHCLPK